MGARTNAVAIYDDITHKVILVNAAGTLLAPTEPMAQVGSPLHLTVPFRLDSQAVTSRLLLLLCTRRLLVLAQTHHDLHSFRSSVGVVSS
jgi:hypothetical protein